MKKQNVILCLLAGFILTPAFLQEVCWQKVLVDNKKAQQIYDAGKRLTLRILEERELLSKFPEGKPVKIIVLTPNGPWTMTVPGGLEVQIPSTNIMKFPPH